jgi:hypothetical protein
LERAEFKRDRLDLIHGRQVGWYIFHIHIYNPDDITVRTSKGIIVLRALNGAMDGPDAKASRLIDRSIRKDGSPVNGDGIVDEL